MPNLCPVTPRAGANPCNAEAQAHHTRCGPSLLGGFGLALALALACVPPAPGAESLSLEGAFVQGGLVQGRTAPGTHVTVDGRPVRVSEEGVFIFGFDRDAPAEIEVVAELVDGTRERRVLAVEPRRYRIQRIDGLAPRKVTPSEEDLKRIRAEVELVRNTRKRDDARTDFLDGFEWPLTGRISGVYGSQRILNGQPRRPHYGIDIAAPVGTAVRAPANGVVTLVHPDMFFSGGTLIVDHGHGLSSAFLHLHSIGVEEGERVRQGQVIATVGATGRVTGAHLDWRINLFEKRLDPTLLVGPMPARAGARQSAGGEGDGATNEAKSPRAFSG
ncbi:MAG: M23 family metallopeptidase [Gammaproteobacteria bacterium]|nr:M23 family metallopeptidase [Gammaproteobacteria bacterium]NIR84031.1 M23 family metallopeptidase [Gammaproteobacteria bacterium]NIR89175.1 M23 family metallopeptidase [Gammaproteobacteria bacterium]NIU04977.1 M23 family metallopeptidase [Gammaproteobacteria bacterium]NIV52143.1 peptidoglycan DD-metalloendopeptidase family protein [Gammaproteobacteria bacterium]